jgi:iron complex transport system substrate-binding protein
VKRRVVALVLAAGMAIGAADLVRAEVRVIDDSGATIVLPRPAHRIVSLAPHLTEQLFAVGAGERIVGTTEFADWPAAARRIARVGRAHSVDLERVAALRPDLILIWGSGFPPATQQALRRLGVPLFVSEPGALDSIATSLERLGTLAGGEGAGAAAAFRARIAALRAQYAQRPPVRVFYQVWSQPLMTLSGKHVISEGLRVCGARNVFEDQQPIAPQVALEAVIAADPDAIVTAEAGGAPSPAFAAWRKQGALRAVRNDALITLDADQINRHGPRLADELGRLCAALDRVRSRR